MKVVGPDGRQRREFIRSFEAEAQLITRLEHPHIVPLYDYWREPDGAYLVMRLLHGGSLRDALRLHRRACPRGRRAARRRASRGAPPGVVHRDIGPANVLLDEDGNAYLSDFAIGHRRAPARAPTSTASVACWSRCSPAAPADPSRCGPSGCGRAPGRRRGCSPPWPRRPCRRPPATPTRACGRSSSRTPRTSTAASGSVDDLVSASRTSVCWRSSGRRGAASPRWCGRSGPGSGAPDGVVRRRDAPGRGPVRCAGRGAHAVLAPAPDDSPSGSRGRGAARRAAAWLGCCW